MQILRIAMRASIESQRNRIKCDKEKVSSCGRHWWMAKNARWKWPKSPKSIWENFLLSDTKEWTDFKRVIQRNGYCQQVCTCEHLHCSKWHKRMAKSDMATHKNLKPKKVTVRNYKNHKKWCILSAFQKMCQTNARSRRCDKIPSTPQKRLYLT